MSLSKGKEVSGRSKLKGLYPLLQSENLIMVGGRLDNAQISENQNHPIVLLATHKITKNHEKKFFNVIMSRYLDDNYNL